ncbi:MAG TPA: class I SAM-dependent methyltransferase family protein [Candidatus Methanofastidiosa archaeon]|nr:class I SAM-dependent methyltransferase family protein [Candidatus Methanofastidiosa archaeon]HPR41900.1 class I SAM-dependent methyltransferase family protein [Candidatus Methanofastidiosa archaeon]
MKGVKALKKFGEETRKRLMDEGRLLTGYRIVTDDEHIYFPVTEKIEWAQNIELDFEKIEREDTFEEMLGEFLARDLIERIHTFDSIGDIAVMEFDEALEPYAKRIAEIFLETHKHYKTVLSKSSAIEGEYRTRQYVHLAGRESTITKHKEYGLVFEMDLKNMFFTPRMANERKRVSDLVKPGEEIIDMFCGIGPFSIAIAKNSRPKVVYAIDINEDAIEYLKRNIETNRVQGVIPICGDSKEETKKLPPADRVIMNLPKTAHEFLGPAMDNTKKGGTIHFYSIVRDDEMDGVKDLIRERAEQHGRKASILNVAKIKPYSPYTYLTSFDIKIT